MTPQIRVVGDAADASLAGLPAGNTGPVVALGSAPASDVAVRWLDRARNAGDSGTERVVAPAGEGLWRVGPWPAADALFELVPAGDDRVVVTGADGELREAVLERAAARGVAVDEVERLDATTLAEAACVVLAERCQGAAPARAFPVLAAGRLLIVPRLERTFGLEDGLDHVQFADPDGAVTLVEAYRRTRPSFARITAWGRLKAEAQRASVVYGRLAEDLDR